MEKGKRFDVLDHGYVKLIDFMGNDEAIVEAARMSTHKGFISWESYRECVRCGRAENAGVMPGSVAYVFGELACSHEWLVKPDGDAGFLEFLLKNNHSSPFEQCELVVEVQAPLFVFREWHRHRTQSYNELSARYTQMPNLHYVPAKDRFAAKKSANKQESGLDATEVLDLDEAVAAVLNEQQSVYKQYEDLLASGVPKEVARVNTPVSRYSRMRAKSNLLNWLKFLNLRMRPSAQFEIRQFANVVAEVIGALYPRTYFLFEEWMLHAVSFGRTETKALRALMAKFVEQNGWMALNGYAEAQGLDEKHLKAFVAKLQEKAA